MDVAIFEILAYFSFALGACIASFLNVVIWRIPRGESIVNPPSHCPRCDSPISWYHNIPIISWLCLRGRCAECSARISPRYILVEILGGGLFLAVYWLYVLRLIPENANIVEIPWMGFFATAVMWIWVSFLIVGSFIDYDHKLLPDFVTIGGMILGFLYNLIMTYILVWERGTGGLTSLFWSICGILFGFGLMWLIRFLGSLAFKREAMGMGDVFLMGAIGAIFGPIAVVATLVLSSFLGSAVGILMLVISKTKIGSYIEIPYGPYIALGSLGWMFFGPELVAWYLRLIGVAQ